MGATVLPKTAKPRRQDPPSRELDGVTPFWELLDKDPEYAYVWANEDPKAFGSTEHYESMGYELVLQQKGGARPAIGKFRENDPIRRYGHVLMQIRRSDKEAVEQRAQAAYSKIENQVVDRAKSQVADHLRGIRGNQLGDYIRLDKAEVSDAFPHTGED